MAAPKPIVFYVTDEAELRFSLSNRRLLEIQRLEDKGGAAVLWVVCDNKGEVADWLGDGKSAALTEELFFECLPLSDPEILVGLMQSVMAEWKSGSKANPKNEHLRPTRAEIQPSIGSGLSPSGESTLVV